MSGAVSRKREKLSKKILAEVDALGAIDDDTLAAFRNSTTKKQRSCNGYSTGEISEDDHFVLWTALQNERAETCTSHV